MTITQEGEIRDMENLDIRILIKDSGIYQKAIANHLGISPEWLSRLLRFRLTPEWRDKILSAIMEMKEEK